MTTSTVAPPAPLEGEGSALTSLKPRKKTVTPGEVSWRVIRMALLIFFVAIILMPIYVVLVTSFKSPADFSVVTAWNLPERLSFDGWAAAWEALAPALVRSVVLAISSAVFASILGSMNGFVFSKWKFPGADIIFTMFLFGMFIPYQAVMIPLQALMINMNQSMPFLSGVPTLIIAHVIYGIPICTLIFRNYYATAVPTDIIEAARVDGAGMWSIFTKIVLPVSAPAFVVTMIWQFTSAWNDFLFALFLTDRNTGPVTYALQELASAQNPDYSRMMAGVLVASLPTLLVYIFLGRYFVSGLMSGSVK
ncbi:carbohydrate ABC transporter permease [Tessaracoccus massiliensis]|uniref:carbohydrate ABC transporter permease n=1 Tax=Tessaracoccus massiliensis TaxID=1522311 RepID=UPI00058E4B3D|nr:carbohydrate ABC transporter permease [Tessaracoccus massiliensis]